MRLPGSSALLRSTLGSARLAGSPLGFGLAFANTARPGFDEFFETVLAPVARTEASLRASLKFLRDFDFGEVDAARARYGRLSMPKCLIWGEQDRFFPLAQGRRLAAMLPDPTRFEAVPRAGLLVHEENPRAWVDRMRSFLEDVPVGPA